MLERYVKATQSSNLRDQNDRINDTDNLKAVAFGGNHLGTLLIRLKAGNDASVYMQALEGLTAVLKRRKTDVKPVRLALHYWMVDNCPACFGRGYGQIIGTPVLSDVNCSYCAGTGLRPQPEGISAILATLDALYAQACGEAKKKLDNYVG